MGRTAKEGMDYVGWSTSIFDNDTTMDKLLDAQGWTGFGIYFYLCQRAHGGKGYFYQWSYDDCATTARKMGGGIGSGTVKEAVGYCLRIGLFDQGLFDRWGILTSRDIQKRYIEVIKKRDVRKVIAEFWLLQKEEECEGLIKVPLNRGLSSGNTDFQPGKTDNQSGNADFQPIKESKVKNSKVKERERKKSSFFPPSVEEVDAYCQARGYGIDAEAFVNFYASKGWMVGKNKMTSWKAAVSTWEKRRRQEKPSSTARKAPNRFHNFDQRDTDYDALLRGLNERITDF